MDNNIHTFTAPSAEFPDYFDGANIRSAVDFKIATARPYLVKGMLLEGQVSLLCGPPNTGKTAVAASIAAHVARGMDMGRRRVRKGGVFYIAAEDATGVLERAYPFMNGSGERPGAFMVSGKPIDLRDGSDVASLIRWIESWKKAEGHERVMVFVDTLNLSVGDGDENSARDMSRAIGNAQLIAQRTRAHVMIVAHVPVADKGRPRGSTALEGNCDTVLILRKHEGDSMDRNIVHVMPSKQRSMPKVQTVSFELVAETVGADEDGEAITVAKALLL
ncbi:helicase RepA family protein [Cereibacter sphaeroides]|uniref:AAA family ATPase n=1 Tax=Cereibacter sphaeroides TaxID=1063 RepID=UPI001F45BA6C|nr:AAA family ATPase [Cereibacter sphaeroides]MCE6962261.1 helicase RepA family protein [Cereibacter sphaeroides]MCE6967142.1 helicase RepA family protein [Cereibacter sphaeroides]MCE6971685.1 helicase RepA family protein [Cereibacter sphaeroides]